ncbi:hypothetical protein POM88_010603 [Heracleum sosnowskyi]|uniref:Reverse transcriptase zinc-binding domain-containing protein n=1 Tax=Heracleum sosnowskyi TaxID=360622 RepID=A0AAD8N0P4_9APIA|nr:hypothetical protein POM88_010603 [Heracleum sosnowskyi]
MNEWFLRTFSSENWSWKIGNGNSIMFWRDVWTASQSLKVSYRRLFSLSHFQDAKLHEMVLLLNDESSLQSELWRRQLRGWEIESLNELTMITKNLRFKEGYDEVTWIPGKGSYTVKKGYQLISNCSYVTTESWLKLWKIKIPRRIKLFYWKVSHNILPTNSLIYNRLRKGNGNCVWCNNAMEDHSHILWSCHYAKLFWKEVEVWWNISVDKVLPNHNMLFNLLNIISDHKCKSAWDISVASVLWSLWLARNEYVFRHRVVDFRSEIMLSKVRSYEWSIKSKVISHNSYRLWA